jgi:RNA polymerase sigma factor (sigma-70 family)
VRAEKLLSTESSYIYSKEYDSLTLAELERNVPSRMYSESSSMVEEGANGLGLPTGVDVRLLTAEGEAFLFRKMNVCFHRANALRARLNASRPSLKVVEEIEQLLRGAAQAREELVRANVRLVAGLAHKYANSRVDYEELLSEGNLILLNAIDKFDISRGYRFSTYATHSVQRHFFRVLQRKQRQKDQEVFTPHEVLAESLPDREPALEPEFDPQAAKQLIARFSTHLDAREQQIIRSRFSIGGSGVSKTLKTIAAEMGLSKERVRQLQYRALEKLREVALELGLAPDLAVS